MPSLKQTLVAIRQALMIVVMLGVWGLLIMVYFDRIPGPVDRLIPLLLPWERLYAMPSEPMMKDRVAFMQMILEDSERVSAAAFFAMAASFVLFSVYLTFLYQQRQRRMQENRLLQIKNQEIARRNEFIRYISATIGHEFKNNLARVKRRIDLLPGVPREARERIDVNLDKLFADIAIFKKISEEREEGLIEFSRVQLRDMLESIALQYRDFADVSFEDHVDPPVIYAAEMLLRTVFENLFDNAVKYRKPSQERALIRLSCSIDIDGPRKYVRLSFRDSGRGMTEEQTEHCFYEAMKTGEGWGKGLFFVKYVVGLHAGKVFIGREHTAPDAGTEIIINLPFVEESWDV